MNPRRSSCQILLRKQVAADIFHSLEPLGTPGPLPGRASGRCSAALAWGSSWLIAHLPYSGARDSDKGFVPDLFPLIVGSDDAKEA